MKKNGFTVIEFIVGLAIAVLLCTEIYKIANSPLVQVEKAKKDDTDMRVVQFDGHKWVKWTDVGMGCIVHHPDCDCFKKAK
jgi:hypothetical protein